MTDSLIKNNLSLDHDKVFIETFHIAFNIACIEIARDKLSYENKKIN